MSEFFAMGGYAAYVWPSFALTALVVLANLFFTLQRRKKVIVKLQREAQSAPAQSASAQITRDN